MVLMKEFCVSGVFLWVKVNWIYFGWCLLVKNVLVSVDNWVFFLVWIDIMDFLRNVSVVWCLGMGFGLLLLLVVVVVVIGVIGSVVQKCVMQDVVEVSVVKVWLLLDMFDVNNQMMVVCCEMLICQGEVCEVDEVCIVDLVKCYEISWIVYQVLLGDVEGKQIGEEIVVWCVIVCLLNKQISELMQQGDFLVVVVLMFGVVQDVVNGWNKVLVNGVVYEEMQSCEVVVEVIWLGECILLQLLVFGGVVLLVGIVVFVLIGCSLIGLLVWVVGLVECMVRGELDQDFCLGGCDELIQLGEVMVSVCYNVQVVIIVQFDMVGQYEVGVISYCMDEVVFFGDYGCMVYVINELVVLYVVVEFYMVEVM